MGERREVKVGDTTVTVIPNEEAEAFEFMVCIPADWPSHPFTDNVRGTCCVCGIAVQFRPNAPKRPARICLLCANKRAKQGATDGNDHQG